MFVLADIAVDHHDTRTCESLFVFHILRIALRITGGCLGRLAVHISLEARGFGDS